MKRVAVVVFPGSNCDRDCIWAVQQAGGEAFPVWHESSDLSGADAVILPGGFSYGDFLRAGALAAHCEIMRAVKRFAMAGGVVVGICNGFQVLVESRMLPGALLTNLSTRFVWGSCWVRVERVDTAVTSFYSEGQVLAFDVAHAQGRFWAPSEEIARLEQDGWVAFRYCDEAGVAGGYNPNGSVAAIAGIANPEGNIVALMPHPERSVGPLMGSSDGIKFFRALLEAA